MTLDASAVVIHSLAHLRAALADGAASGRPVVALSAPAATAFAGAAWFAALAAQGRAEFPEVALTAILDCGDRAGDALAALQAGASHLVFTGHPDARARLAAIAAENGAVVLDRRPAARDVVILKNSGRTA